MNFCTKPVFVRLGWKTLLGINTSLLQKLVNYGQKSFITLAPSLDFKPVGSVEKFHVGVTFEMIRTG